MRVLLPDRLRELREAQQRNQSDMARIFGLSRSTYNKYEKGEIEPPMSKLWQIADYYGVSVDWLVGRAATTAHRSPSGAVSEDIGEELRLLVKTLQNADIGLNFNGAKLTDDTRELLHSALELVSKTADALNRP